MRILRLRPGFQADHSSSSYLFYAVDGEVSAAGRRIAGSFSSSADVEGAFARYQKWGESHLRSEAYPALLGEYYDVMASESYDTWTLMIAVPKTPQMEELLRPFHEIEGDGLIRLDVHDYGKRLAVEVNCEFSYDDRIWMEAEDTYEMLVELLAEIRADILKGDVSFLEEVAEFYGAGVEEEEEEDEEGPTPAEPPAEWTKAQLQEECTRRGVTFRKSWTKEQLRQALTAPAAPAARPAGQPRKLSRAARRIVGFMVHV